MGVTDPPLVVAVDDPVPVGLGVESLDGGGTAASGWVATGAELVWVPEVVSLGAPFGGVVLTVPELEAAAVEGAEVPSAEVAAVSLGLLVVVPPTLISVESPPVDFRWCLARAPGLVEGASLVWTAAGAEGCAGTAAVCVIRAGAGEAIAGV